MKRAMVGRKRISCIFVGKINAKILPALAARKLLPPATSPPNRFIPGGHWIAKQRSFSPGHHGRIMQMNIGAGAAEEGFLPPETSEDLLLGLGVYPARILVCCSRRLDEDPRRGQSAGIATRRRCVVLFTSGKHSKRD